MVETLRRTAEAAWFQRGITGVILLAGVIAGIETYPELLHSYGSLLHALDKLIPAGVWRHDRVDGNAASHIQAAIMGPGETIPLRQGKLLLGTWQAVMLVELDGPRERRVVVTVR